MREARRNLVPEICSLIAHASDHKQVLQEIVRHVAETLNASVALISIYDAVGGQLEHHSSYGFGAQKQSSSKALRSILQLACERGKSINTVLQLPFSLQDDEEEDNQRQWVNSLLAIPLIVGGKSLGCLALGRRSKQVFPSSIVGSCEALAVPLATFIENAKLNQEISGKEQGTAAEPVPSEPVKSRALAMNVFSGRAVVSGLAWGRAILIAPVESLSTLEVEKTRRPEREFELMERAMRVARHGIRKITQESVDILAESDASIFDMYLLLLDDPMLRERLEKYLGENYTLNSALNLTYKEFSDEYQSFSDEYLRERLFDLKDVLLRIKNAAANISGGAAAKHDTELIGNTEAKRLILVAEELLPTQLIASPLKHVCGIICESGGPTSHAAILAKALHIPMLIADKTVQGKIKSGDSLLLDCQSGQCYVRPKAELLRQFRQPLAHFRALKQSSLALPEEVPPREQPKTRDGVEVRLAGNVTLFSELVNLHNIGVHEIGLYRTEFMFMIRNMMPSEEDQFRVLSRLVEASKGNPVCIRALDIGGDKPLPYINWEKEDNPSLGWRGLRFLLSNPEFLHSHLRAILRTSALGKVSIMFPMVGDIYDLEQAKSALEKARQSLLEEGLAFDEKHRFGIMLELPSAVMALDRLLPLVDFVSIGTNDLIQYLFAVDRANSKVTRWFRQCHPIVWRTLGQICRSVEQFPDKELSICGELAGQPRALPLLLGAGLRRLSMNANFISEVRACIEQVSLPECRELFEQACECRYELEVQELLSRYYQDKKIDL
ncbi:MAG: phosphoenolpyruvate--protein phosphotransferase [Lentisphaeria bacterium]